MIAYAVCFLIEIAGMVLILWDGVPLFRHLIRFERVGTPVDANIMLIAVVLIQATYWASLRHDPPFDLPRQQFIGHVFLLLSRLIFIFASGVFSLVVYRYPEMFEFSLYKTSTADRRTVLGLLLLAASREDRQSPEHGPQGAVAALAGTAAQRLRLRPARVAATAPGPRPVSGVPRA